MSFTDAWHKIVLPWETPRVTNDPDDPGGPTAYGISKRYNPRWEGWQYYSQSPPGVWFCINQPAAAVAAWNWYEHRWHYLRCDQMPDALGLYVFDTSILWGAKGAGLWLQEGVNAFTDSTRPPIFADGIIGPRTVAAVQQLRTPEVIGVIGLMASERIVHHLVNDAGPRREFLAGHIRRSIEVAAL